MKITFLNTEIELEFAKYQNDNIYIGAFEVETGEPFMDITTNVMNLPEGQVAIKNYSENEGILDVLVEEKIVSKPINSLSSGFVNIPVCKLLVEPK
jgi:hypothetical protein